MKVRLSNVLVAFLQRDRLQAIRWRVEHELTLVQQTLSEPVLPRVRVDVVAGDVDKLLDVLGTWFEESRSVAIRTEKGTTTDAATSHRIRTTRPEEPQLLVLFIVHFQVAEMGSDID